MGSVSGDLSITNRRKPLTDEMTRILRACSHGAMHTNSVHRWVIDREPRPRRRDRELLQKRGYIRCSDHLLPGRGWVMELTELGVAALGEQR
jgi:hypothetical protein